MRGERPVGEDDLQAFVDGHLAAERRDAVEAYLATNPGAAAQVTADRKQRDALRARLVFKANEPIPSRLRVAHILAEQRRVSVRRWAAVAAALAWLVVGGALGWFGHLWLGPAWTPGSLAGAAVAQDAIAAYRTYVVETAHPVEVGASEEAHLVQWLSRRLGRPLSAPDLTAYGFRLMGGRLLPAGTGPAALFMYDDNRGTRLTLYVRPDAQGEQAAFRFEAEGDIAAFSWIDRGLSYVIAARTDRSRLLGVAEAIHRQLGQRPAPKVSL